MQKDLLTHDIPQLVAFITSEIRTRADKQSQWARFKNENMETLRQMIGLPERSDCKPGDVMGFDIGFRDPATSLLRMNSAITHQGHHGSGFISPLLGHGREIDRSRVYSRRRASLEPADSGTHFT